MDSFNWVLVYKFGWLDISHENMADQKTQQMYYFIFIFYFIFNSVEKRAII